MNWNPFRRSEPVASLREQLELAIKAGRRCAHDLAHAADCLEVSRSTKDVAAQYHERAKMWQHIFYPAGGVKDYRHRLHSRIDALEKENERLEAFIKEHGLDHKNPRGIPF